MGFKELLDRVKRLNLPAGKFALFGSSPLAIRGIVDARDIDIIVTEDVWEEYEKKWKIMATDDGSRYLWNDEIELWRDWKPGIWDIEKLIKESEAIEGLPFVRLKEVMRWKKLSGRDKDKKHLMLIGEYLKK